MGYAFISYSTKNQSAADAIRQLFHEQSIDTWMAPYDVPAGSKYAARITGAIRDCACFVLLLSNASQMSEAVDSEVELAALTYRKTIITVQLEDVVLNDAFTFYIHNKQIIAVNAIDKTSPAITQVLNAVRAYTDGGTPPQEDALLSIRRETSRFAPEPSGTYALFIEAVADALSQSRTETRNSSKYYAVLASLPDLTLLWADARNDTYAHFLSPCREEIDSTPYCQLLPFLQSRSTASPQLKDALTPGKILNTVRHYYNYQSYFKMVFSQFCPRADLWDLHDEMRDFMGDLCRRLQDLVCLEEKGPQLLSYIHDMEYADGQSAEEVSGNITRMSRLFFKLSSLVLLTALDAPGVSWETVSLIPEDHSHIFDRVDAIMAAPDSLCKKYARLYTDVINTPIPAEAKNDIIFQHYEAFFRYVNDPENQAEISRDRTASRALLRLYQDMYHNVKYVLYREYGNIYDNCGLMRNSFMDRMIVDQYLECMDFPYEFEYRRPNNTIGSFVLRLAEADDAENIYRLNNPQPKPYRRAVYVKSSADEIRTAIESKNVWIIEEATPDGEYALACAAVILFNKYNDAAKGYASTALNEEFAEKYYSQVQRPFTYLDFDSVLVNDGKSGVGGASYRGYGFQRLCLVLAEALGEQTEGCEYICATVSSINLPSKRNFMLNGYQVVAQKKYGLSEDEISDFEVYLSGASAAEQTEHKKRCQSELRILSAALKKQSMALDMFGITVEGYIRDREVPRDFIMLKL